MLAWVTVAWGVTPAECLEADGPVVTAVLFREGAWSVRVDQTSWWGVVPRGTEPTTLRLGDRTLDLPVEGLGSTEVARLGITGDVGVVRFVANCGIGLAPGDEVVVTRAERVAAIHAAEVLAEVKAAAKAWADGEGARLLAPELATLAGPVDRPSTVVTPRVWWSDDGLHVEVTAQRVVHVIGSACGQPSPDCEGPVGEASASRTYTRVVDPTGEVTRSDATEPAVTSGSYPARP